MRVTIPEDEQVAVAVDTLVDGVHFPSGTDPEDVGYKAVAVNLSDLAAMGARPRALSCTLLTEFPDDICVAALRRGMGAACRPHRLEAPRPRDGRGPFTVCVSALGTLPRASALTRAGARHGDRIYVTGELGDAGLALREHYGELSLEEPVRRRAWSRLRRPTPRVSTGMALRGIASAAIDVSDGLVADLNHLCRASRVGAHLRIGQLPLSDALLGAASDEEARRIAATGGDDYELCFTVPPTRLALFEEQADAFDCRVTEIGIIEEGCEVLCLLPDGSHWSHGASAGYRHFRREAAEDTAPLRRNA